MRRSQVGWMLAAFLLAASIPALAQQGTSAIGGKITDEQGAVLPGVAIRMGEAYTSLTPSSCRYSTWARPSLKVKRMVVMKEYADEIAAIYR